MAGVPGPQYLVDVLFADRLTMHRLAPEDPATNGGQKLFQTCDLVAMDTVARKP